VDWRGRLGLNLGGSKGPTAGPIGRRMTLHWGLPGVYGPYSGCKGASRPVSRRSKGPIVGPTRGLRALQCGLPGVAARAQPRRSGVLAERGREACLHAQCKMIRNQISFLGLAKLDFKSYLMGRV
jgi:hypothetical protein